MADSFGVFFLPPNSFGFCRATQTNSEECRMIQRENFQIQSARQGLISQQMILQINLKCRKKSLQQKVKFFTISFYLEHALVVAAPAFFFIQITLILSHAATLHATKIVLFIIQASHADFHLSLWGQKANSRQKSSFCKGNFK